MKLRQFTMGVFCFCAIIVFSMPAHAGGGFENVVTFGDSLSDNGPVDHIYAGGPGSPDLYGFYPFTSGTVWAQQLADAHGASMLNVAIGGATTGVGNLYPEIASFAPYWDSDNDPATQINTSIWTGLNWQVNHDLIKEAIAPMNKRKTLFTVWAGANDYNQANFYAQLGAGISPYNGSLNMLTKEQQIAIAKNAVTNIRTALDTMENELGARHIMVSNLMNLAGDGTYAGIYNAELGAELLDFQSKFKGKLYFINVFSLCEELYLGLNPDEMTLEEKVATGLWWTDGYHPGHLVHDAIAELAIEATDNQCRRHPFAKLWARGHRNHKH